MIRLFTNYENLDPFVPVDTWVPNNDDEIFDRLSKRFLYSRYVFQRSK